MDDDDDKYNKKPRTAPAKRSVFTSPLVRPLVLLIALLALFVLYQGSADPKSSWNLIAKYRQHRQHLTMADQTSPYVNFQRHILYSHNMLRRAMEQLIEVPPSLSPNQVSPFLGYTDAFLDNLKYHHGQEDDIIFPALKPHLPQVITELEKDHRALAELMVEMREYIGACRADSKHFKAQEFVVMAQKLQNLVKPHLNQEEHHFQPDLLQSYIPDPNDLRTLGTQIGKRASSEGSKFITVPFITAHLTEEERLHLFGRVPFLVREVVFPVYGWRYAGYWQFAKTTGGLP